MNDANTNSNLTLAENSINNNGTKKNLDPEKLVNIPKKKFQSTPALTLVKLGNRKDIFGEEIKKGGKHRISFVDYKMPSVDNIDKKTSDYKNDFAEIIDIMSYKAHTKKMSYKEVDYEEKIYCNNCNLF